MNILVGLYLIFLSRALCIKLIDGGYEDVNIILEQSVKENDVLIQRIKEAFTNASKLLFSASKYHVFFRKINIIIPNSWSQKPEYKRVPASSLDRGYILVGDSTTAGPHVKGLQSCGGDSTSMFLPTRFFLKEGYTNWGYHENTIVHEWGHFRWGIFDEYAYFDRGQSQFYLTPSGWKPVTCTEIIKGSVGFDRIPDHQYVNEYCNIRDTKKNMHTKCTFHPSQDQSVNASLMGHQWIISLTMFCDNGTDVHESQRHDRNAPNYQNIICEGQSAWEVMRKHADFSKYQQQQSTDTTPIFEIYQETVNYRVFVLDVSGSMASGQKIKTLHQTADIVIKTLLPLKSWLGIVTFNSVASIVKSLMEINSDTDRDKLSNALPLLADGGTCISCGVKAGIQDLSTKLGNTEKSEIIVVSDGESDAIDKNKAITAALAAGVVVHTVSVTQEAGTILRDIAQQTGGMHQSYLDVGRITFAEAFAETLSKSASSDSSSFASLVSEKKDNITEDVVTFTFALDSGLGRETMVTVLTRIVKNFFIELYGPSNYHQTLNITGNTAIMKLPGIAKAGDYNVTITGDFVGESVEYYAKSLPSDDEPITVSTKFSTTNINFSFNDLSVLYVDVSKGYSPVIHASVTAKILADFKNCSLELSDNGEDPDVFMNDGTYTGYIFPQCLSPKRVNVKVYVSGGEGKTFVARGVTGSAPLIQESPTLEVIMDTFQRVKITEDLYVSNYTDPGTVDKTSPGRITNVDISYIVTKTTPHGENRNFTITWTATGDDKNIGRAASYEFKISDNMDTLLRRFENASTLEMINETIIPKHSGETENVKIVIDAEASYTESAFFAMRAVDDAGNVGPVSNIVSIVVAKDYRATINRKTENDEPETTRDTSKIEDIIIGVSVSGGLVLIIIIFIILCYVLRKRRPKDLPV